MPCVLLLSLVALTANSSAAELARATPLQDVARADAGEPLFQRARALAAAGDHAKAAGLYGELLARDPSNADARLARGRAFAWMRKWDAAEADLTAVTAAVPDYVDAWSALGDMYLWSGRPAQAVDAYSHWRALQPDRAEPLLARSRAHDAAGNPGAARSDLDAAAALGAEMAPVADVVVEPPVQHASNPEAVAPTGYTWALQAEFARTTFSGDRADWQDRALVLRRYGEGGSVALELLETRRFGRSDQAWAVDGYVDTWKNAYANLRYQHAPDGELFPGHAWRAELFQGLGGGWEVSGSIDQLRFDRATTIYGAGVGRYVGRFYLRARSRHAPAADNTSHQGLVRYYYAGNGNEYFEFTAGTGRSQDERLDALVGESASTAGVALVRYLRSNLGFKLAASYTDDTPRDARLQGAAYYRW